MDKMKDVAKQRFREDMNLVVDSVAYTEIT